MLDKNLSPCLIPDCQALCTEEIKQRRVNDCTKLFLSLISYFMRSSPFRQFFLCFFINIFYRHDKDLAFRCPSPRAFSYLCKEQIFFFFSKYIIFFLKINFLFVKQSSSKILFLMNWNNTSLSFYPHNISY